MDIQEVISYLKEAARWAPSADNSQPWRLNWDGEALAVGYDAMRVRGMTFPPENPATLVAMGAVLENLHQAAEAANIRLERSNNASNNYFRLYLSGEPSRVKGIFDHPLFSRHTNRLPFRTNSLPTVLADWLLTQSEGDARLAVVDDAQAVGRVARLVGQASELRFQTREIHELLGRSLRFTPGEVQAADGLDVATLHLPPGGRSMLRLVRDWPRMQALNRFGAYKFFASIEARSFANASVALAVLGAGGREGGLNAGRLLERVWIELNRCGLAVHPFYVLADQMFRREDGTLPSNLLSKGDTLAEDAGAIFNLQQQKLYMLLRVGYPSRIPVKSRRLPIQTMQGS